MLNRRRVLLGGAAVATAAAFSSIPSALRAEPGDLNPEVIAWLKANALPLATAEPGTGVKDLEQLRPLIGDARVVSLGEATHGTREFFQLKHRVMEYCISQLGFTVIGFEADYGATLAVNDYVLRGNGNARDVATGMGFWTWDTEEVAGLIEWVRGWNLTHDRKVKFYGFDMQSAAASALHLLAYLERVAPELATESDRILGRLGTTNSGSIADVPAAERELMLTQIKTVFDAFTAERAPWIARTSEIDWYLARQSAIVVQQCVRLDYGDSQDKFRKGFEHRDRCMADNVHALLEIEGPGTRAVLWAHNGHVQHAPDAGMANMGSHLHAELGAADYRAVGFAFNQGGFRAKGPDFVLRDYTVGPAPEDSVDGALAATGIPLFALDLMHIPPDGPIAAWMAEKPGQRSIGAFFDPDGELAYADFSDPRDNFDVLLFVETTTAARGIERPSRIAGGPIKSNKEPANLALAGGTGRPDGWYLINDEVSPYVVSLEDGVSPAGGRAVRIGRSSSTLPWGDGTLAQFFDAAPWRGRRLVFSAAMRADAPRIGTGALLVIRVYPKFEPSKWFVRPVTAMQAGGLVRSSGWVRRSAAVDIPADADSVEISLAVTGNAAASFGDLAVASEPGAVASWATAPLAIEALPRHVPVPALLRR